MPDFKAKMHQIRFRLGLRPRHRRGAYSAPPDPLAGCKLDVRASTSKGDGREVGEGARAPLKFGKEIFFGQLLRKILAFSGKNHVKFGNFRVF